jgi:hypothetical protein
LFFLRKRRNRQRARRENATSDTGITMILIRFFPLDLTSLSAIKRLMKYKENCINMIKNEIQKSA